MIWLVIDWVEDSGSDSYILITVDYVVRNQSGDFLKMLKSWPSKWYKYTNH